MPRSAHGLDDKNSVGPNGYRIMSTGEAFLGENWPTEAVWRKVWGQCFEEDAKGSFETDIIQRTIVGVARTFPGVSQNWTQQLSKVIVTVSGNYGPNLKGWGVRDAFMHDLLHHHNGDGGVWYRHGAHLLDIFGSPWQGWWAASWTAIRRDGDGDFWVNIELNLVDVD